MKADLSSLAKAALLASATMTVAAHASPAAAQATIRFHIAPQPLGQALREFGLQSGVTIYAEESATRGKQTPGFTGSSAPGDALAVLLRGSGLTYRQKGSMFTVAPATSERDSEPAGLASSTPVASNDIIVTAQKREQKIQDVPIAISAFSGKTLDAMKIETGGDLLKSIPNVTFSKNNFAGYNFSIRGIGTKAVAASTDPGVAVAFNSSNLIVNRLFEQEFYDIERVEVLRGPQGTLRTDVLP